MLVLSLAVTSVAAGAPSRKMSTGHIKQKLIARTADGGAPNARASQPTISWDGRIARYVAYTSAATNIESATNGRLNVFVVKRKGGGRFGTPWKYGSTKLVSRGLGGPANGDSSAPSLGGYSSGDRAHSAKCLGFVSRASNLVKKDTNGRADVFITRLSGGGLRRIAAPAGTNATDVAVSGNCRVTVIVANGALYRKRGGGRLKKIADGGVSSPGLTASGSGVSYSRGGEVYVRRSGGERQVATGAAPAPDAGLPQLRWVSFLRGGYAYYKRVGGGTRGISSASAAHPTAGGAQVFFSRGHLVYMYAIGNNFGAIRPLGYCPPGQGNVTALQPSARGNYVALSCAGGQVYLSYVGPK